MIQHKDCCIDMSQSKTNGIYEQDEIKAAQKKLIREHEELNRIFKLVETAKTEWERSMDCVKDIVILVNKEGRIKRCNRPLIEFTGLSYEDILYKNCKVLLCEYGLDINIKSYEHGIEVYHKTTNKWFLLNSYPFKETDGNDVSGTVVTIHDTTELKNITGELENKNIEIEENKNKLQHALNEISSLINKVASNKDTSIRYANPNLNKCYEVQKCNKKECPCYGKDPMRCWQIIGNDAGQEVKNICLEESGDCLECPVFKEATSDPIYQIGEYFNNMMNILDSQNKELESAYDELKHTQAQVMQQEKMASIGQLAAGVAHEINNPLAFISSNLSTLTKYSNKLIEFIRIQSEYLESLETTEVAEDFKEKRKKLKIDYIIEDINSLIAESFDGADRVRNIVQNLKSFSRIDEQDYKQADIIECIESTINIVWNELKYKATVKKEYGDIPLTHCYPQQLNQVFMNLLVNASHAIGKQGEIIIKTWHENNSIFISISDTGCGIPEENLNRLFEPFFTTKEVGKGTGLGLSISYDIVKKHKGDIVVHSEVGKGTTFTVKIPVVESKERDK
ncbi:MAG: ATP-binding protein [Nitrospirota bacterium]